MKNRSLTPKPADSRPITLRLGVTSAERAFLSRSQIDLRGLSDSPAIVRVVAEHPDERTGGTAESGEITLQSEMPHRKPRGRLLAVLLAALLAAVAAISFSVGSASAQTEDTDGGTDQQQSGENAGEDSDEDSHEDTADSDDGDDSDEDCDHDGTHRGGFMGKGRWGSHTHSEGTRSTASTIAA